MTFYLGGSQYSHSTYINEAKNIKNLSKLHFF